MREVKFRIWDKDEKKIREVDSINFPLDKSNGKVITAYNQEEEYYEWVYEYELMQYTGLKDKNGKEIYEGDIIDIGNGEIFLVGWHYHLQEFTFLKRSNYYYKTYRGATRDEWIVVDNLYQMTEYDSYYNDLWMHLK